MDVGDLAERLHERLSRMLDRAKLSNGAVALALDVTPESVSRWRKGKHAISDAELEQIVDLLAKRGVRVTMGWMRYGEVAAIAMPDPLQDRKLTAAEEQRALRESDARKTQRGSQAKAKKRRRG